MGIITLSSWNTYIYILAYTSVSSRDTQYLRRSCHRRPLAESRRVCSRNLEGIRKDRLRQLPGLGILEQSVTKGYF